MTLEYELYIKDRFLRILSSGANLTELCNFLASCISAPVAITLTSKTIIAKSQDYTGNLVDEYVNSMNLCEMEELQRVQEEIDAALASQQPETRTWPYSRHKRIICGCFWHGRMLAVIDCPIIGKNLSADAEALVALAAPIFMTALRLNSYIDINTVDPIQTFITGLLRGEIDQKNQMISPIYSSVKNWRALFITVNPGEKTGPIYSAVDAYCLRSGKIWSVEFDGDIIVLLDAGDQTDQGAITSLCRDTCRVVVTDTFTSIFDLPAHIHNARNVIRLNTLTCDDGNPLFEKKYKILLWYLSLSQNQRQAVEDPIAEEIKKYDQEHDSAYFETLKNFLLLRRNYLAVADKMHIHKNTAAYRIQRISEMFGIDFKDNSTITSLYLSLFTNL